MSIWLWLVHIHIRNFIPDEYNIMLINIPAGKYFFSILVTLSKIYRVYGFRVAVAIGEKLGKHPTLVTPCRWMRVGTYVGPMDARYRNALTIHHDALSSTLHS